MRLSKGMWQTYKEVPADAEIPSHRLMMRAGLIHKSAAGIYNYLPFGYRVIRKVEQIIREEMDAIDSQEILMSVVTPGELWQKSGRWDLMGEMLKFKDKRERDLCISPTNEEAVTDIFESAIKSYKDLPVSLYQINTKFRDEIRPRFGLLRGREFTMKDAYTFHIDKACLDEGYEKMYGAYEAILKRMDLEYIIVEADAGAMADSDQKTHEFQVVADNGEDEIIYAPSYAANIEKAKTKRESVDYDTTGGEIKVIETPNMATIEDVCNFLKVPQTHSIKSLVYESINGEESEFVLIQLLGDDQLNEVKLKAHLKCEHLRPATDNQMKELGFVKGFIGAHKMPSKIKIIFDEHVSLDAFYTAGANEADKHFGNFNPKRDSGEFEVADLRLASAGDFTWDGKEKVELRKGIEVGHIFQLGQKYTQSMNITVLDNNGKAVHPYMGCYGAGVTRIVAAAIEQNHDENGIIWPKAIAPYHVYFASIAKSEELKQMAEEIYKELKDAGIEVLFDDRKAGPGFKFKDSDLLGLPLRIVIGDKTWEKEGKLEWVERKSGKKEFVGREELISKIKEYLK